MNENVASRAAVVLLFALLGLFSTPAFPDPFPPYWNGGSGSAVHFPPVPWASETTLVDAIQQFTIPPQGKQRTIGFIVDLGTGKETA
jgi:hypothetical protein